jgi:hypothetical protein
MLKNGLIIILIIFSKNNLFKIELNKIIKIIFNNFLVIKKKNFLTLDPIQMMIYLKRCNKLIQLYKVASKKN